MKNMTKLNYLSIITLFICGINATAQSDVGGKPESRTLKLMTYNLKFASPTFKPAWEV